MMSVSTALAILVTGISPSQWDIAACARFYYPESDKRISHYRTYLMSLNGKLRKAVGPDKATTGYLAWSDRNHLVWLDRSGRMVTMTQLDVRTNRQHCLGTWLMKRREFDPDPLVGWQSQDIDDWFASAPSYVRAPFVQKSAKSPGLYAIETRDNTCRILSGGKSIAVINSNVKWQYSMGSEGFATDRIQPIAPEDEVVDFGSYGKWKLLGLEKSLTAHEGILYLFRLNMQTGKAWVIPADVVQLSVQPKRNLWIGVSERSLGGYATYDVWAKALTVGRIDGGKPKVVCSGRVNFASAVLRP